MRLILTVFLILTVAACGRKGPLERAPGATVPPLTSETITTGTTEPTKPRGTLF